jgi:putative membrane protein
MTGPGPAGPTPDGPPPGDPPPGVQPERTALAWQRTALALTIGSLGAGRLLSDPLGPVAWLPAVLGVLAAVLLARTGTRRALRWARVLDDRPGSTQITAPDGRVVALAAGGTLLLGVAAAVLLATA